MQVLQSDLTGAIGSHIIGQAPTATWKRRAEKFRRATLVQSAFLSCVGDPGWRPPFQLGKKP
jgi:hypothetical protein